MHAVGKGFFGGDTGKLMSTERRGRRVHEGQLRSKDDFRGGTLLEWSLPLASHYLKWTNLLFRQLF
jgi:hypothetical protein